MTDVTLKLTQPVDAAQPKAKAPAVTGAALPANSYLSLITTHHSLQRLAADWRKLEKQSSAPSIFQSYDWIKAWADVYALPGSNADLFIITGFEQNKLVFLWPMALRKAFGQKILTWLGHPIGQYGDVLCDKSIDASRWIKLSLNYIKSLGRADFLHLRHVRDDAAFAPFAKTAFRCGKLHERAPALDLTRFATEADYDARYDSNQRRRRKKIRKSLETLGQLEFNRLKPGQGLETAIDRATAEKLNWLKERGRFNKVLSCPNHASFLKKLATVDGAVQTVITEMTAGGKAIAWEVGFRHGDTHFGYMTSHLTALTDHAPGRLMMDLSQRLALKDGMKKFDLMVPYDQHKESWSSMMEPVNDWYLPLTAKGAIHAHLWLGLLRPLSRWAYQNAPQALLRLLKPLLRQ